MYDSLNFLLEIIAQELPALCEIYLSQVYFNPCIWVHTSPVIQKAILLEIRIFVEKLPALNLIDILMHNVVTLCATSEVKLVFAVSDIIALLAKNRLDAAMIAKISSYANVYYIRKNKDYPLQLYYVLRILMTLFNEGRCCNSSVGRKRFIDAIKEEVRVRRESKYLTTLWIILDYILHFRTNGVDGEYPGVHTKWETQVHEAETSESLGLIIDDALFDYCTKALKVVDAVQAIALYLLACFDWSSCQSVVKDYQIERSYYPIEEQGKDLYYGKDLNCFILRTLEKSSESASSFSHNK